MAGLLGSRGAGGSFPYARTPARRYAQSLLVPMDDGQTNHLKAYGIAYWVLTKGMEVDWLLNYRGGSFMIPYQSFIETECRVRGVAFSTFAYYRIRGAIFDGLRQTGWLNEINSEERREIILSIEGEEPEIQGVFLPYKLEIGDFRATGIPGFVIAASP